MGCLVLVWRPLLVGRVWEFPSSLPTITDNNDVIGPISCPLIPEVVYALDSHRNAKGFTYYYYYYHIYILNYLFMYTWIDIIYIYIYIYLYLAVVVLGVLLCIDCLMAAWHTSWPRVWFRLVGGLVSDENLFRFPTFFKAKTFWSLALHFFFFFLVTSSPSLCN